MIVDFLGFGGVEGVAGLGAGLVGSFGDEGLGDGGGVVGAVVFEEVGGYGEEGKWVKERKYIYWTNFIFFFQ